MMPGQKKNLINGVWVGGNDLTENLTGFYELLCGKGLPMMRHRKVVRKIF